MDYVDDLLSFAREFAGAYTQPKLRRAGSGAYYAVFHAFMHLTGQALFGASEEQELARQMYARSISHSEVLTAALDVGRHIAAVNKRRVPPPGVVQFFGEASLPDALLVFCENFPELQHLRHKMDYDLGKTVEPEELAVIVRLAEEAVAALRLLHSHHPEILRQLGNYVLFSKKVRTK